jgi:hypothetical protein
MFEPYYGCMDSARRQKQKLPEVLAFVMNRIESKPALADWVQKHRLAA